MILNQDQFTAQEKVKIAQNRDNIISWIKENICEKLGEYDDIIVNFTPTYSNKEVPTYLHVYANGKINLEIGRHKDLIENMSAVDILNIMAKWQDIKHALTNHIDELQKVKDSIDDFTI